jgi:glycosyltransferase involved in cell wall biosynthesis
MKKKICIVTCSFPHFEGDNRAFYMKRYVAMFKERYEIVVVAPRVFKKSLRYEETDGCKVYRFPSFLSDKLLVEYERLPVFRLMFYMVSGLMKSIQIARKEKCDLINAHFVMPTGLLGVVAGKLLRIPVLMTTHGTELTLHRKAIFRPLIRMVLNGADLTFTNSYYSRDLVMDFKPRQEPRVTLLCGVDTDQFHPGYDGSPIRRKIGVTDDDCLILTVANLTQRRKRVDILIRALSQVKDENVKLLVLGRGPLRAELEALAAELGVEDRISYIDFVEDEMLPVVYNAGDIFVLPSAEEGLGVPVMEAMSSALPVIGSRSSGILSLIRDGEDGLFFEKNNFEDLAEKIKLLSGDRVMRERLSRSARLKAETVFSREVQKRKIIGLIEDLPA